VVGDHRELPPGASFDVWMAYIGGMNFHQVAHPQPTDTIIDPSLFDFSDLIAKAQAARAGTCFDWAGLSAKLPKVTPAEFALEPIYPNPFNSAANIRFSLARETNVTITVYDLLGRDVEQIANGTFTVGNYSLSWNANDLPSGLYFVQARTAENIRLVQKAMLLK
jgi:hypothetical protein